MELCRNRCLMGSTKTTEHQCDPGVVGAAWLVCGLYIWLVVSPLLSVCLSIPSLVLGRGAGLRAAGFSHSLCPQKPGLQTPSPPVISQNLRETGTVRHLQNYSFNSFLLITQMFPGKHRTVLQLAFTCCQYH